MKLRAFFVGAVIALPIATGHAQTPPDPFPVHRAQIMVVGTYHFVSTANVNTMPVDDPMTAKRQREIVDLVNHLKRFRPTKIILEETSGTSHLEQNYQSYVAGHFTLPPSENYQIGFRIAKSLDLPRIYLTDARTDFDFDSVVAAAKTHGQMGLMAQGQGVYAGSINLPLLVQKDGTILDMYRLFNSEDAIRLNNSGYMYVARVGGDKDFAGARLVGNWYLRNLEMFAQMTRLVSSPDERIMILYGQGHAYLLRDFVRQSLDLTLVDASDYLR